MKIAIKQSFDSSAGKFVLRQRDIEQDDFQSDLHENQIQHSGKNENFLLDRIGITKEFLFEIYVREICGFQ